MVPLFEDFLNPSMPYTMVLTHRGRLQSVEWLNSTNTINLQSAPEMILWKLLIKINLFYLLVLHNILSLLWDVNIRNYQSHQKKTSME